jgi:hypothetical protein
MTDTSRCVSKDCLLDFLYDEAAPADRAAVEAHLAECPACRQEVEELRAVRGALARWPTPILASRFRIVADEPPARRAWWAWGGRALPLAAAAVLVLAAAAGVANLEVRYGPGGVVVRTGWPGFARGGTTTEPAARSGEAAPALDPGAARGEVANAAGAGGGFRGRTAGSAGSAAASERPWEADLASLAEQLRREFQMSREGGGPMLAPVSSRASDAELLRRVQAMIDESEIRQQRNLALRVEELSRDFNLQRQADLVEIQRGFGRTEAEVQRARELVNYLMRVSQQPR